MAESGTTVFSRTSQELGDFLEQRGLLVEEAGKNVLCVKRIGEQAVFICRNGSTLFFQADLGSATAVDNREMLYRLLDLNTEILPVSVGVDTTKKDDPRLVLVESREAENLDDNELLAVLDALELAVDKVEAALTAA